MAALHPCSTFGFAAFRPPGLSPSRPFALPAFRPPGPSPSRSFALPVLRPPDPSPSRLPSPSRSFALPAAFIIPGCLHPPRGPSPTPGAYCTPPTPGRGGAVELRAAGSLASVRTLSELNQKPEHTENQMISNLSGIGKYIYQKTQLPNCQ